MAGALLAAPHSGVSRASLSSVQYSWGMVLCCLGRAMLGAPYIRVTA